MFRLNLRQISKDHEVKLRWKEIHINQKSGKKRKHCAKNKIFFVSYKALHL